MKVCEQCGKLNYNDGAKFCQHCGGVLTDYAAHKRQKLMRKVKIGGGLGTAAVVAALIAFAVIWFAPNDVKNVYEYNGKMYISKENGYGKNDAVYSANADMSDYKLFTENASVSDRTPAEDFVWNGVLYAGNTTLNLTSGQHQAPYAEFSSKRFYDGLTYETRDDAIVRLATDASYASERATFYELPEGSRIGRQGIYVRDGYLYVNRQIVSENYDNRLNDIDMVSIYDPTQVVSFSDITGDTFVGDSGEDLIRTVWDKITVYGFNLNDPLNKFQTYHNYGYSSNLGDVEYNGDYYHISGRYDNSHMTVYKAVFKYNAGVYAFEESATATLPITSGNGDNDKSFFRDGVYYFLRGKEFYIYSLARPNQFLKYAYKDKKTGYVLTEIVGELSENAYIFGKKGAKTTPVNTSSGNMSGDTAPPSSQTKDTTTEIPSTQITSNPSTVEPPDGRPYLKNWDFIFAYCEAFTNGIIKSPDSYDGVRGIGNIKLVDFENDGVPEMVVFRKITTTYDPNGTLSYTVYGYNGDVYEIYHEGHTSLQWFKICREGEGNPLILSYLNRVDGNDSLINIFNGTLLNGTWVEGDTFVPTYASSRDQQVRDYLAGYVGDTISEARFTATAVNTFITYAAAGDFDPLFADFSGYLSNETLGELNGIDWLVQPTFDYAHIQYCPYHGFVSVPRTSGGLYTDANGNLVIPRDEPSYVLDENLNIVEEHLGHGLDTPIVFYNEWSGDWEVMTGMGDWYPDWKGKSLSDFFGNEPYIGSYVSGYLNNGWIAGGVGVIRDNKVIINASQEIESAMWLGTACAYRKNNRWTIALDNGEEVATGLFGVKESHSQKSEKTYCFAANDGNLWGVVSIIGDTVIPYEYEDIVIIDNTRAYAKQNGKYGVIIMNWAG
ncbi:hypothetical protein FACS189425_02130 [Clostridia bacterium]|nr:hypothetical protein FACS189425_02130 [Clostridia bacterium]